MLAEKKCRKCRTEKKLQDFPKMNLGKYGRGSTCFSCMKLWQKPQKEIKRTPVAKVGKKRAERIARGDTETKAHKQVYSKTQNCIICGKYVYTEDEEQLPHPLHFAHILSKKDWAHLRTFPNNYALVCSIEHHDELDTRIAGKNKKKIEADILAGKTIDTL